MLFNWTITIIIIREKSLSSPFMLLTLVKSFLDAVYVTVYFLYITPMIVLANKFMILHSDIAGYILIICYEISIHTHFLTSLNRFTAVFFPFSYKKTFSTRATAVYLICISLLSFAMMTTVIYGFGCRLAYDPNTWVSFYDVTIPICEWYAYSADFMKNLVLVFADTIIDIITLLKVQKMRKQFRDGKRTENYTKKETDFLKQTLGQGICYLMGYASYLMVPEMNSNKYVAFFMSLVSWCLIAMIDGLFTIVYNSEIRKKIGNGRETSVGSTVISIECDYVVETIGSRSPFPLILIDVNLLEKLESSEECYINEWSTVLVGAQVQYKNITISQMKNFPIELKIEYYKNETANDYLEFINEPKRIIPEKFPVRIHGNIATPSNIPKFLEFLKRSKFRDCLGLYIPRNITNVNMPAKNATTAMALLRDELIESGIFPFLNGGTLLGWYRECSVIPHTNDMDLAVFAEDYKPQFLEKVQKNQSSFGLGRQLGMINDSFELTFYTKSDFLVYIDLFLMYKETKGNNRWIGGMSEDGQKYKFPYPPYDPWCSADLHGHLFWVTCSPRNNVEIEYGKLWYLDQPSSTYDWSSPGKKNGIWTREQMKKVNNVYKYLTKP